VTLLPTGVIALRAGEQSYAAPERPVLTASCFRRSPAFVAVEASCLFAAHAAFVTAARLPRAVA